MLRNKSYLMHVISVHFWACSFVKLQMLSLFCHFTVIGGKNVFLRLSLSGECENKDSVWKILQKEVLYLKFFFVCLFFFFPGK